MKLLIAVLAVALLAISATAGSAAAATTSPTAKGECIGVGKGAAWKYKGQKGTTYTVIGVAAPRARSASCGSR